MALTFINEDGGTAPEVSAAITGSKLRSDYAALDSNGKSAFRTAIAADHNTVANTAAITGLTNAQAGDTASTAISTNALYRFGGGDPTDAGTWQNIVTGAMLDVTEGVSFIDGDGSSNAGVLADAWAALSPAQKAAFRNDIKPQYSSVADQAARLAQTNRMPGDYTRQVGTGVFRLVQLPASTNGNWEQIIALSA